MHRKTTIVLNLHLFLLILWTSVISSYTTFDSWIPIVVKCGIIVATLWSVSTFPSCTHYVHIINVCWILQFKCKHFIWGVVANDITIDSAGAYIITVRLVCEAITWTWSGEWRLEAFSLPVWSRITSIIGRLNGFRCKCTIYSQVSRSVG